MGSCGIVTMSHCASLKTRSSPGEEGHCVSHWVPPGGDNPLQCQPAILCSIRLDRRLPALSCVREEDFSLLGPAHGFSFLSFELEPSGQ